MYSKYIKRLLDIVLSLIALIVLAIPMLIIALLVWIKLGTPVLFVQERPGKEEKIFKILKFRTMTEERDSSGKLLPDEVRLTRLGKILRETSMDELPQLFNIIKGDMSVVGPRALLPEYLPRYTEEQKRRHVVRPGLTNLVAVNGRNNVPIETKLEYDEYYVDHLSFFLDAQIVIKTFFVVLKREGVQLEESKNAERCGYREE